MCLVLLAEVHGVLNCIQEDVFHPLFLLFRLTLMLTWKV